MSRKKIAEALLKKLLGVPTKEQGRLAGQAGIPATSPAVRGEQLDIFKGDTSTPQIERWAEEGAPGLSKYLAIQERVAKKQARSPRERLVAEQERVAERQRELEERLGLDFDRTLTDRETSILFDIDQATEQLTNLKTDGTAKKNLDAFAETLTNQEVIKDAIKAGLVNPNEWNVLAASKGLPPWPEVFRTPDMIAKISLGLDPYRTHTQAWPSPTQKRKIAAETKRILGGRGKRPTEEVMSGIDVSRIRENIGGAEKQLRTAKTTRKAGLPTKEQLEELRQQEAEGRFLFSEEDRLVDERGKPIPTQEELVEAGYRKLASDPSQEPPTGVNPRTGELLPEELPWSQYAQERYNELLKEKRVIDPNYTPTGAEERALQKQAWDEVDKEWPVFSDKMLPVDMPSPSAVRQTTDLGEEIIPVEAQQTFIRGDVGSPASAMSEQMRGSSFREAAGELEPEQAFTTTDIDEDTLMQRAINPQAVRESIQPTMAIPPNVNIEEAFGQRRRRGIKTPSDRERAEAWKKLQTRPEFERYMKDTVARERQLDLPLLPEPTPEIATDLRKKAAKLREDTEAYRQMARVSGWDKVRKHRDFKQYIIDRTALQREIYNKAPDLMEFEVYTRPQRTKSRLQTDKKLADAFEAISTGFIKKDGTANIAAWKKAGSPKPLDWEDTDRVVRPKRKLVDSFKKGSKIVQRKRGGMIKKPRGWGAARYKGK